MAGWDAFVHLAWCRATVSGRPIGGKEGKFGRPTKRSGAAVTSMHGSEGWLWVFEDAWAFRPAAAGGHRFR